MPSSPPFHCLIDKEEVARRLGVTPSAINKWMADRRISYYRLGHRCVRFAWDEVLADLGRKYRHQALRRFQRRPRAKPKLFVDDCSRNLSQLQLDLDDPCQGELVFQPGIEEAAASSQQLQLEL